MSKARIWIIGSAANGQSAASVLTSAGVSAAEARSAGLQVFAVRTGATPAPGAGLDGFPTVWIGDDATANPIEPLLAAIAGLQGGDCRFALAAAPQAGGPVVLLERSQQAPPHAAALVLSFSLQARSGGEGSRAAACLRDACTEADADPRSLTLLSLCCSGPNGSHLEALSPLMVRHPASLPHCALGPLLPGTSAAAALESVGTVARALRERVLPALDGQPPAELPSPFCAADAPRPWIGQGPRRAAVLGLGPASGAAVLLEQAPGPAPVRLETAWPQEVVLLAAGTRAGLTAGLRKLAVRAGSVPLGALARIRPSPHPEDGCRAAIVADSNADLIAKLHRLAAELDSSAPGFIRTPDGIHYCEPSHRTGTTAFLMPGQGSQYIGMFGDVCLHIPHLQGWFERHDSVYGIEEKCRPIHVIAPARYGLSDAGRQALERWLFAVSGGEMVLFVASLGIADLLKKAGATPDAMLGCSHGEIAALIASGTWRFRDADDMFATFTRVLRTDLFERAGADVPCGAVAAISRVRRDILMAALARFPDRLFIALDNCPEQVVLFGDKESMECAVREQQLAGAVVMYQPFDRGYHTPAYEQRLPILRSLYQGFDFGRGHLPLYSCTNASLFPDDPEGIRELAVTQWVRTVRFREAVERLYRDGVRCFVEIGPNSRLTSFVHSTLRGRPHVAVASNTPGQPGLRQLLSVLGLLYVWGHDINVEPLRPAVPETAEHQPEAPAAGEAPAGQPAERILAGHFALMRNFLDGQRRINARLFGEPDLPDRHVGSRPEAEPLEQSYPMLGARAPDLVNGPCERVFTTATDPFLIHHRFGRRRDEPVESAHGLPLVPFSFEMELLAEAGASLTGARSTGLTLRNMRANRYLAVDDQELRLKIASQTAGGSGGTPEVHLRLWEAGEAGHGPMPAFEGIAIPGAHLGGPLPRVRSDEALVRVSPEQLYARLCHGPRLQVIRRIMGAGHDWLEAIAGQPDSTGLFCGDEAPVLRIPAAVLDGASQLIAWWLMEQGVERARPIPMQMRRYAQTALPPPGTRISLRGRLRRSSEIITADFDLRDGSGTPFAQVEELMLRLCTFPEPYFSFLFEGAASSRLSVPADGGRSRKIGLREESFLAGGQSIWLRVLGQLALTRQERPLWQAVPAPERLQWLLVRLVAKELVLDALRDRGIAARPGDLGTSAEGSLIHVRGETPGGAEPAGDIRVEIQGTEAVASFSGAALPEVPMAAAAFCGSNL